MAELQPRFRLFRLRGPDRLVLGDWLIGLLAALCVVLLANLFWIMIGPLGSIGNWKPKQPTILPASARMALFASFDPFSRTTTQAGGEVAITLTAAPAAARASQPFQLVLREVEGGRERPVAFSMISTSENNGVPQGYRQLLINSTDLVWLTVVPAPPSAPEKKP